MVAEKLEQSSPLAGRKLIAVPQVMNFAAGLYSVELSPQAVLLGNEGLTAPCVRLDRLRPNSMLAGAYVSSLSETDLIVPGGPPAYVRVVGDGTVPILLTVYRLEHMPAPELQVRVVEPKGNASSPAAPAAALAAQVPPILLVHVERLGDVSVEQGVWGGTPGSGNAIEGFAVRPPESLNATDIEYQGALGMEWDTPWFRPDEFCGSRGMSLPLLGVRIRVTGDAASRLTCRYWGSFVGFGEQGPFAQGALCAWNGAPLEALRIEFVPPVPDLAANGQTGGQDGVAQEAPPRRRRLLPSRR